LLLPRAWTRKVQAIGLSAKESDGWEQLRLHLAAHQGVADDGAEPRLVSVHRFLGYPDERQGHMPSICEAVSRGIDLTDAPYHLHPDAAQLEAASGRWRLLLQLSVDETFGWHWGPNAERLYVWIDEDDLRRRDFSRIWAIPQ
jgi:uncharacterized protein YwqG